MGADTIVETKLEILVQDFQRFRDKQEIVNKELIMHSGVEDNVQAKILTTLKWHTVIGTAMASSIGAIFLILIGA